MVSSAQAFYIEKMYSNFTQKEQDLKQFHSCYQGWVALQKEESIPGQQSQNFQVIALIRDTQVALISEGRHVKPESDFSLVQLMKLLEKMKEKNEYLQGSREFARLLDMCNNHRYWKDDNLSKLLKGEHSPGIIKDWMEQESTKVTFHRVRYLYEKRMFQMAFNLSNAILTNDTLRTVDDYWPRLLGVHALLMIKLKAVKNFRCLVQKFSFEIFVSALEYLHENRSLPNTTSKTYDDAQLVLIRIGLQVLNKDKKAKTECVESFGLHLVELGAKDSLTMQTLRNAVLDTSTSSVLLYTTALLLQSKKCASIDDIITLYLRGFSLDLNLLEGLSMQTSKGSEKDIVDLNGRYSMALQGVMELLKDSDIHYRECLLTAFSLTPTTKLYTKINDYAIMTFKLQDLNQESCTPDLHSSVFMKRKTEDFEQVCESLSKDLSRIEAEKKLKNTARTSHVEGLISIQGSVLTSKPNYDPTAKPLEPFSLKKWGVSEQKTADLVIAINGPRWHTLSWLLDWKDLKERCQELLMNPTLKNARKELKHLVIDYTEFGEWSSDEDVDMDGGIEKGYENWEENETTDDESSRTATSDDGGPMTPA